MITTLLGAHVSIAGGLHKSFNRGIKIGCEALQIFVKNASRWNAKPLTNDAVKLFQEAHEKHPMPLVAHSAYLINLCAVNAETHNKSRLALADELERCTLLGVPGLVLHPGAHMEEGEEKGIEAIARSLDSVFATNPKLSTKVLLENTAGQGTVLGYRFEQIGRILELVDESERLGVCFDSCHAFAAGYDLRNKQGYESVWEGFDEQIGLNRLEAVHLNDSKFPLGLRKDRHATIGGGEIGLEFFSQLIADERFTGIPMLLETPLDDDGEGHRRDLETLRSLHN